MKFKEIEFKYDADNISLEKFLESVKAMKPNRWLTVSSYDQFFVKDDTDFVRYRYTDERGELTIKKKTTDKNNFNRIEVNLPTSGDNFEAAKAFCELLGYTHNFGIYKTCKIAFFEKQVLVYYIVYDMELKEKRRFIEIEANEDYAWESDQQAWDHVTNIESELNISLGITPKNRLRKSLFEMFKKDKQ